MATDKKKGKAKGKGGRVMKPAAAVLVFGIIGLVGMYYFKTGALPFEDGKLAEFLKLQWLR